MSDDPRIVVRTFLDGLPNTIKSGLLSSVAGFYSGRPLLDAVQANSVIAEALQSEDALASPRALAFLCASIDHVLIRPSTHAEIGETFLERAAKDTGDKGLESAVLGEPLRERHFQQVHADWAALRANQLSAQKIVDFQYNLLKTLLSSLK
jgi:hypothetical protein